VELVLVSEDFWAEFGPGFEDQARQVIQCTPPLEPGSSVRFLFG
jgi:hypothetical protein